MARIANRNPENYEEILEVLDAPMLHAPVRRLTAADYEASERANAERFPLIVVEEGDLLHDKVVLKVVNGQPITATQFGFTRFNDRGQPLRGAPTLDEVIESAGVTLADLAAGATVPDDDEGPSASWEARWKS